MFMALRSDFVFRFHQYRGSLRRDVRTECQVVAENGFRLLGERTLDVSADGLLLASRKAATVGEEVLISLKNPGGCSWIDAQGRVARVLDSGLAIVFDEISAVDRALLQGSLRGFPPPVPRRRPRPDYAATVLSLAPPPPGLSELSLAM